MSAGEKITLDAFVARVDAETPAVMARALEEIRETVDHLSAHLASDPDHADLNAQVRALSDKLPADLAAAEEQRRAAAARAAIPLVDALRDSWIAAEDPPLVDEIDRHLGTFRGALERLHRPGPDRLAEFAHRIDVLAEPGRQMEGIERAYLPWAAGAAILFVVGIVLFFSPGLLGFGGIWPILFCLIALPAVAVHFALRVMPRSRADAQIETLNRAHFLPLGGIYFPESETPAGVVLVEWRPEPPPDPKSLKDPRKERDKHKGPLW